MSTVHFCDVIRLLLLSEHGGIWIDCTVLITGKPREYSNLDFFAFSRNRDPRLIASWWLEARQGSYIINFWLAYLIRYWEQHEEAIDYFLMHHIFESLYFLDGSFEKSWDSVPRISADPPHELQAALFEVFTQDRYQEIVASSTIHKLTWKHESQIPEGSFLEVILSSHPPKGSHFGQESN
jgi:hypothetical protein